MKTQLNALPKYWVVECNTDNPDWQKVIDYLKNVYGEVWQGCNNGNYYGYDGNHRFKGTDTFGSIKSFKNNPTILTIEQFIEMTERFILPEKWYCKPTNEEDAFVLGKYFDDNKCGVCDDNNFYQNTISTILNSGLSNNNFGFGKNLKHKEITFEQFKKYVLMEEENTIPEYVECIKIPSDWDSKDMILGKIYRTDSVGYPIGKYRIVFDNFGGQTTEGKESCFISSTKEVFDKQNQVKEFSKGTYVVAIVNGHALDKPKDKYLIGDILRVSHNFNDGTIGVDISSYCCNKIDFKWFATTKEATEFSKTLLKKETMRTITYTQAQEIIDIACTTWKDKLFEKWGKSIVLRKSIVITELEYQEMRKACTSDQNQLFDDIFGKDVKFKVGDWVYIINGGDVAAGANELVGQITDKTGRHGMLQTDEGISIDTGKIVWKVNVNAKLRAATEEEIQKAKYIPEGTPCLVRDLDGNSWRLAYSNGDDTYTAKGK